MSLIRVPVPWYEQPQDPVEVDGARFPGNLSVLLGSNVDPTNGRVWTYPGQAVGQAGRVLTVPNTVYPSGLSVFPDSSFVIPTGQLFTLIYVNEEEYTGGRNASTLAIGTPGTLGTAEFNCFMRFAGDGNAYFRWGGNSGSSSINGAAPRERGVWVLSAGLRGMEIWHDGVLIASNTSAPSRTGSSAALFTGANNSDRAQAIPLLATFAAQFSREDNRALSLNPWQLFRERSIPVPFAAGGGVTIPTLSLPTVIDIGPTSARPRVTITF
jgi:hypothetical protein